MDLTNHDNKVNEALDFLYESGQVDGTHHKAWVIDQVVRILTGDGYDDWVANYEKPDEGDDPDDGYEWDVGIPS